MTLHKLKVAALQQEQREDWPAAIALYRQAIREAEASPEGTDPSLYNRVGDLAIKAGDRSAACEAWDQAVARYADLGFLNSAIALCGKIIRLDPDRLGTYLELARLQARKRVLYDVHQNLARYLKAMSDSGRAESARDAVERLGEEFSGWTELELLLDELLERQRPTEPARDAGAAADPAGKGLVYLDTGMMRIERASEPADPLAMVAKSPERSDDLVIEQQADAEPLSGFEATAPFAADPDPSTVAGLVSTQRTASELESVAVVEGLQQPVAPGAPDMAKVEGLELTAHQGADPDADRADESDDTATTIGGDLVFIATDAENGAPSDDPLGDRVEAESRLDEGDRPGGVAHLEAALGRYQQDGDWLHAFQVASDLVLAEPDAIGRHQTRVETASKLRDNERLCLAYTDLGDALQRLGSTEKAIAVYRRVLELDDVSPRVRAALKAMAPETVSPEVASGFIDLGAMLVDDHPVSTRMRTEMPDVAPDEQDTFRDALNEFKRAIDQNLPIEDHQAHYDLGIAFKEMGLLDEAVSEFQKALRAPEVRLRTSEALGEVFFDQGKTAVAEAVLRGVENDMAGDADKIGVLYWLGRSLDAQGKHPEAIGYYQRIIAVDVSFRDAGERLTQSTGERTG